MADFSGADLRGSRFERADLSGSEFSASDLAGSRFRGIDFWDQTVARARRLPPPARSFPVRECLLVVLNEEWEHRLYAERDLAALEHADG